MLEPLGAVVTVSTARTRNVALPFTLAQLAAGRLVLLGNVEHWVLAVGVVGSEWRGVFVPEHFLILDPMLPAVPLAAWNSIMTVATTGPHRMHRVIKPNGDSYRTKLTGALAIGRAARRKRA